MIRRRKNLSTRLARIERKEEERAEKARRLYHILCMFYEKDMGGTLRKLKSIGVDIDESHPYRAREEFSTERMRSSQIDYAIEILEDDLTRLIEEDDDFGNQQWALDSVWKGHLISPTFNPCALDI